MPIVDFTATFMARELDCPAGKKRIEYCDSQCPGLLLEVRAAAGSVPTWYLRYKAPKTTYERLGNVQTLTLAQARKAALAFKLALVERRPDSSQQVLTLDRFVTEFVNPYNLTRKRSHCRDVELYRRIQPRFGHMRLEDIRRLEVQQFHNELVAEKEIVTENGPVTQKGLAPATADHHVVYLRRLLNLAVEWEYLDRNPLTKIPLMRVDNRKQRYLSEEEVDRLVTVLRADPASGQSNLFLFLLNTGARLNEAMQAQWAHIDKDRGIWTIPSANSKSKKGRVVPLNEGALWVIDHLPTRDVHTHLFVNPVSGKPFVTITRAWYRLRARAGLDDVRVHDLRHSFASRLVNRGRSLYEVQQILGHASPQMTMRYAHLSNKSLLEAANAGSVAMV